MSLPHSDMNRWTPALGLLLVLATLGIAEITAAKQIWSKLGLAHTKTECDGYRVFRYVATWRAQPGSKSYQLDTANRCRVGPISCDAAGQCKAQLNACQPGPSWVHLAVTLANSPDIPIERITVPWPTDKSGKKAVCE